MERISSTPRQGWQKTVESQGLLYHTPEGNPYWDESAYYQFSMKQIELIESTTNELYELYLNAAQHVIDTNRFAELGIPERVIPYIKKTWDSEPPSVYGRFDLAYNGTEHPKLLEFNADTPTGLLEAAVIQWYWKEDCFKSSDQFTSIHEKLIEQWKSIAQYIPDEAIYFVHMDDYEDWMTVSYLRDTASQAGISSYALLMEEIGWNRDDKTLRDLTERQITAAFKLYPWEWLINEIPQGGEESFHSSLWIEPIWRMLWSNKGMLAVLWELNPGHPALLEAHIGSPSGLQSYAQKPIFSREGSNVTIVDGARSTERSGPYGGEGYVFQALAPIPEFSGNFPILGSWYITDQGAAGMGIRESSSIITDNLSRFVPHIIS